MAGRSLRETVMQAYIEEQPGGLEEAVEKLEARGLTALQIAIEILGGPTRAADRLGMTRQKLNYWLGKDVREWKSGILEQISTLTRIPIPRLMKRTMPVRPAAAVRAIKPAKEK